MGRLITVCIVSGLLLCANTAATVRSAQTDSLEKKLDKVTDYVPKAIAPVDQLVEVAQKFKIPMAIEWVDRAGPATSYELLRSKYRSVRDLIVAIATVSPERRVEVDNGIVRVYSPNESVHPYNFLNIKLKSYGVKDDDLFAADEQLRWAIRFTLEPEKYRNGYAGGYGHGANHVFQIPKFTLSESDVTIREVLNRIALTQGNALWVATIKGEDLNGNEPCWRRENESRADLCVTSAWHFVPLAEIAELASERVAIDLTIEGVLDERMTTIPVMLEHGLIGDSGGATGGSSSDGSSYQYASSIEKIGRDFVTISVHLRVGHKGEAEINFDEKFEVHKDRITEVRPESRIKIRAYFERADQHLDH